MISVQTAPESILMQRFERSQRPWTQGFPKGVPGREIAAVSAMILAPALTEAMAINKQSEVYWSIGAGGMYKGAQQ